MVSIILGGQVFRIWIFSAISKLGRMRWLASDFGHDRFLNLHQKYLVFVFTVKLSERPDPPGVFSGSGRRIKWKSKREKWCCWVELQFRNSSAFTEVCTLSAFSLAWVMETPSDFTVGLEFIFAASPCKCCFFPPPLNCLESFSGIFFLKKQEGGPQEECGNTQFYSAAALTTTVKSQRTQIWINETDTK